MEAPRHRPDSVPPPKPSGNSSGEGPKTPKALPSVDTSSLGTPTDSSSRPSAAPPRVEANLGDEPKDAPKQEEPPKEAQQDAPKNGGPKYESGVRWDQLPRAAAQTVTEIPDRLKALGEKKPDPAEKPPVDHATLTKREYETSGGYEEDQKEFPDRGAYSVTERHQVEGRRDKTTF